MARTKSSRGIAPFQMRSGNSPMSLFGLKNTKFGKFVNKAINKTPVGMAVNALKGGGNNDSDVNKAQADALGFETQNTVGGDGTGNKADAAQQIAEIHAALVQDDDAMSA